MVNYNFREWLKLPIGKQLIGGLAIGLITLAGVVVYLFKGSETKCNTDIQYYKQENRECDSQYAALEKEFREYIIDSKKQRDTIKIQFDSSIKKLSHE